MKTIDFTGMDRQEIETYAMKTSLEIEALNLELAYYKELIKSKQQKTFGAKSEQSDSDQLSLFNEAEAEADESLPEPKAETACPTRKKKAKGKKDRITRPLSKETVVYSLTGQDANCPRCGEPLHVMKKQIHKELEIIPAKVTVKEHIQLVYSCRNCEKNDTEATICTAPMPAPLLRNSLLSPSMAAYLCVRKYENRDPLAKIAKDFSRQGVSLSRQTLCNWILALESRYLRPLYDRMKTHLLALDLLHGDETTLQVLKEEGRTPQSKSYLWVLRSGKDAVPIVVCHYAPSRAASVIQELLQGFRGYLQSDGYAAYGTLGEEVTQVGCLAHARRYYWEAKKALPKTGIGAELAQEGIHSCDQLFHMEQELLELPMEQRIAFKDEKMRPVFEKFFAWAQKQFEVCPTKGLLQKALKYTLNQKEVLLNYLCDPRLELSNNLAERTIKPFVLGRNCWLFCDSPRGAQASAVIYSVMQTAIENGLLPFPYFEYLFDQLRRINLNDPVALDRLLPWSGFLPDHCFPPVDDSTDS